MSVALARSGHDDRVLFGRAVACALLLLGEGLVLGLRFDTQSIQGIGHGWWMSLVARVSDVIPLAIAVATAALLFGGDRLLAEARQRSTQLVRPRYAWPLVVAHVAAFAAFFWITARVLEQDALARAPMPGLLAAGWVGVGLVTVALWTAAVFPPAALLALAKAVATVLLAAAGIGVVAWCAGQVTAQWWYPLRHGTMRIVHTLVNLFPDPVVEPTAFVVGTKRFTVEIAPECSGYEGIGLIWVFLGSYLVLFRRSLRFPRALLLLPIGTVVVWLANALRIVALIAVGTWISPAIAFGGFHSYAGSLLFCAVGLTLAYGARRSRFFATADALAADDSDNPTAAYLGPFLGIVATSMLTGAFSAGQFDALYFLRVLVAGAILWSAWHAYEWRWSLSWQALLIGTAVFVFWIALERGTAPAEHEGGLAVALAAMPPSLAAAWLVFRVVGAVVAVPLAEELAFRGYLLRRLVAPDFRAVPLRRFSLPAFVISSLLFGAMHSGLLAGTLAGMAYALAARRRGNLGDAVVAHATTNALLAAYVLTTGAWSLWG